MGVRDEEINRLIKYSQGMGLSVRFKPYFKGSNSAEWAIDGTEITIYITKKTSKIDKILSLIHELSHHKSFVDNERQMDPKVEEALDSEENKKSHRKRILDMEVSDSIYWEDIYRDTNCQFDVNRLYMQKEFDIWQYQVYYEKGKFPKSKEKKSKWKELKEKYRK